MKLLIPFLIVPALLAQAPAKKKAVEGDDKAGYTDTPVIPGQKWKVHDAARPRPVKIAPGLPLLVEPPPADAEVLFDGKDLSKWVMRGRDGKVVAPGWKVENGYLEVTPQAGRLLTKSSYGDVQLHVEWQVPKDVKGAGQSGGNSGVELMSRYEIQVLESLENVTYADGQAASIYGQWPPLVNASRPKGEWNVFDIYFEAPKFDGEKLVKPAYVTVVHNGILMHHHQEIIGAATHRRVGTYKAHAAEEPLSLQDHGQAIRYRNIWIRRLKAYDSH